MKKKITHYSIIAFAVAILGIAIGTIASNTTISFQIPQTIINTIGGSSGSHATVSYDKKGQPGLFILSTGIKPVNVTLNLSGIESLHCSGQLVGTYTNPNWFQNVVFPIDNDTLSDFTTKTDSFHGYGNLSMSGGLYTNCSGYNSDLVFGYINYKYSGHNNLKIWAGVKTGEDGKIANFLGKEDEGQLRVIQGEELTLQGIIYDSVSSKGLVTPGNGKYASGSLEFTGENVTFDNTGVATTTSSGISVKLGSNMVNYTWVLTGDIDSIYSGNFTGEALRWYYVTQPIYLSGSTGPKRIYYSLLSGDDIVRSKDFKIELSGEEPGNNDKTGVNCSFGSWSAPEIPQNGTSTIDLICTGFKEINTSYTLASRNTGVIYSNTGLGVVTLESTETGGDTTTFTLKFTANETIGTGTIKITGDVIHDLSGNYNKPTERSPILTVTGSDTPGGGSQSDSGSVECAWGGWSTGIVSDGESATIALTCTGTSGAIVTQTVTGSSVWDENSSLGTISDGTRDSSSSHGQDSQSIASYTFTFTGGTGNGDVKLILREGTVCNNNGACNTSTEESGPLDIKNNSGGGNDPEPIEPPVCRPGTTGDIFEFTGSVDVTCNSDTGTKVIVSTGNEDPSCSSSSDNENIWTGTFTQDTELKVIACTTSEGSNGSGSTIVKYRYRRTDNQGGGGGGSSGTSLPVITITGPSTGRATSKTVSATATNNPTTFQYTIVTSNTECSGDTLSYSDYTSGSGLTFTAESDSGKYVCFKATNDSGTVFAKSNIIDKIDRTAPTFTFSNGNGNECSPGILSITNASDTGAGLHSNAYKFGSGNWLTTTGYSILAQQPGTITVTGYVRDKAGNEAEKTATYTFNDVVPTASGFSTGNVGNTARTITIAQFIRESSAREGDCQSNNLSFSGVKANGTKGNCSISNDILIYTPNTNNTGSDTCVITIKDNENSTVDVSVRFNGIDTTDHGGNDTPGGLTNGLNIELHGIGENSDEYASNIKLQIIWSGGADTRKILFTTSNTCPTSGNQYYTFQRYGIADNYNGNTSISSFVIPTGYEGYYVCVYGDNGSQYGIARTNYPIKFIHTNTGHTGFYYISPASGDIVRPGRITLRWHQSGSGNQYDYKWEIATSNFANSSIVRSGWRSNTNTVSTTIDETGTYYRRVYEYIGDTGYVLSGVRFYIAETGDNGIYGCDSINNTGNLSGLTANQKLWGIVFVDSLVETYQDSPQKLDNFLRTFRHVLKDKYDRYCKLIYEADNNTERQEYKEAKDAVQFIYWVIGNRLDDLDLDSYEVYIAPNGKQYRVEYDRSRSAYTSPDFVYTKYFPTREIFTSHIDINNPAVGKWGLKGNVVTAYNGKQYTIYQTTDGRWTSDNFIYKKYFKNKDEIIDHILVNNTLSNWNHELDTSFDPITYTAPNGKPYEIFKTSKDGINGNMYSSYEFASAKYFPTLEAAKKHIDQNNPKK